MFLIIFCAAWPSLSFTEGMFKRLIFSMTSGAGRWSAEFYGLFLPAILVPGRIFKSPDVLFYLCCLGNALTPLEDSNHLVNADKA